MTRYAFVLAALLIGAPAAAQDPLAPIAPAQTAQECEGERFVFAWGVGARPTRVILCSEKGASTEQIIAMLQDGADKIESSSLPEDRRSAIAFQIRSKIAELQGRKVSDLEAPLEALAPPVATRPVAPPVQTSPLAVPAPPARELPPAAPAAPAAPGAAVIGTQLQFRCYDWGQTGPGSPCLLLDRDTRLAVTALESIPAGTSLRFVSRGSDRAGVALGAMVKGQSTSLTLTPALCRGVLQTQFEILVVRAGQAVDKAGPFRLRC